MKAGGINKPSGPPETVLKQKKHEYIPRKGQTVLNLYIERYGRCGFELLQRNNLTGDDAIASARAHTVANLRIIDATSPVDWDYSQKKRLT
jgi:hypothetical protein